MFLNQEYNGPACPEKELVSTPWWNEITLCLYSRLDMTELRFLTLRHQYGGSLAIVANGQTLDPSRAHVKLKGKTGSVRVRRLPASFYDGIVGETECIALGVMVLNKLDNTTVAGSSNSPGNSPPRSSPAGPPSMKRKLQEITTPPTNPITTTLMNFVTGPPTKSPTNPATVQETGEVGKY